MTSVDKSNFVLVSCSDVRRRAWSNRRVAASPTLDRDAVSRSRYCSPIEMLWRLLQNIRFLPVFWACKGPITTKVASALEGLKLPTMYSIKVLLWCYLYLRRRRSVIFHTATYTRRGHSGIEGGRIRVTYFAYEGVFFKTSACLRLCQRRVLFCTQIRRMGVENPLKKFTRLWRLVTPEVTGLPSL